MISYMYKISRQVQTKLSEGMLFNGFLSQVIHVDLFVKTEYSKTQRKKLTLRFETFFKARFKV